MPHFAPPLAVGGLKSEPKQAMDKELKGLVATLIKIVEHHLYGSSLAAGGAAK